MDFIEVYNNVLPFKTCDFVMNLFKSHKNFVKDGGTLSGVDKKFKDSSDLDLIEIKKYLPTEIWQTLSECIRESYANYILKYPPSGLDAIMEMHKTKNKQLAKTKIWSINSVYPLSALARKYKKGVQGYHAFHADQGHGFPHVYRQQIAMFYLNDVTEGGETEFFYQNKKIKPTKGSLVIFPAFHTHLHKGNIPISNDKYILNFWLMMGVPSKTDLDGIGEDNYFLIKENGYV